MNDHGITVENLLASLPNALKQDPKMYALASAIADVLAKRVDEIQDIEIYARIDELPSNLLDILAQDFKVDWWDANYSAEEKRRTLKESWRVHRMLGTKAAVETAISAIYPHTKVSEWFEYGGKPYHFRLHINASGRTVISNQHKRVLDLVTYYKNLRSHLDEIEYTLEATKNATARFGGHVTSIITLAIPAIEDWYLFSSTSYAGGAVASVATMPIPIIANECVIKEKTNGLRI